MINKGAFARIYYKVWELSWRVWSLTNSNNQLKVSNLLGQQAIYHNSFTLIALYNNAAVDE